MAYECDNCNRIFKEPAAAYSVEDKGVNKIFTSESDRFDPMEFLHAVHAWYKCPYCGSENIIDLNEKK